MSRLYTTKEWDRLKGWATNKLFDLERCDDRMSDPSQTQSYDLWNLAEQTSSTVKFIGNALHDWETAAKNGELSIPLQTCEKFSGDVKSRVARHEKLKKEWQCNFFADAGYSSLENELVGSNSVLKNFVKPGANHGSLSAAVAAQLPMYLAPSSASGIVVTTESQQQPASQSAVFIPDVVDQNQAQIAMTTSRLPILNDSNQQNVQSHAQVTIPDFSNPTSGSAQQQAYMPQPLYPNVNIAGAGAINNAGSLNHVHAVVNVANATVLGAPTTGAAPIGNGKRKREKKEKDSAPKPRERATTKEAKAAPKPRKTATMGRGRGRGRGQSKNPAETNIDLGHVGYPRKLIAPPILPASPVPFTSAKPLPVSGSSGTMPMPQAQMPIVQSRPPMPSTFTAPASVPLPGNMPMPQAQAPMAQSERWLWERSISPASKAPPLSNRLTTNMHGYTVLLSSPSATATPSRPYYPSAQTSRPARELAPRPVSHLNDRAFSSPVVDGSQPYLLAANPAPSSLAARPRMPLTDPHPYTPPPGHASSQAYSPAPGRAVGRGYSPRPGHTAQQEYDPMLDPALRQTSHLPRPSSFGSQASRPPQTTSSGSQRVGPYCQFTGQYLGPPIPQQNPRPNQDPQTHPFVSPGGTTRMRHPYGSHPPRF